jgi:hypothetical protein
MRTGIHIPEFCGIHFEMSPYGALHEALPHLTVSFATGKRGKHGLTTLHQIVQSRNSVANQSGNPIVIDVMKAKVGLAKEAEPENGKLVTAAIRQYILPFIVIGISITVAPCRCRVMTHN